MTGRYQVRKEHTHESSAITSSSSPELQLLLEQAAVDAAVPGAILLGRQRRVTEGAGAAERWLNSETVLGVIVVMHCAAALLVGGCWLRLAAGLGTILRMGGLGGAHPLEADFSLDV